MSVTTYPISNVVGQVLSYDAVCYNIEIQIRGGVQLAQIMGRYVPRQNQKLDP